MDQMLLSRPLLVEQMALLTLLAGSPLQVAGSRLVTIGREAMTPKYRTLTLGILVWIVIPTLFASVASYFFSWNFWTYFVMAVGAIALNGAVVALLDD